MSHDRNSHSGFLKSSTSQAHSRSSSNTIIHRWGIWAWPILKSHHQLTQVQVILINWSSFSKDSCLLPTKESDSPWTHLALSPMENSSAAQGIQKRPNTPAGFRHHMSLASLLGCDLWSYFRKMVQQKGWIGAGSYVFSYISSWTYDPGPVTSPLSPQAPHLQK